MTSPTNAAPWGLHSVFKDQKVLSRQSGNCWLRGFLPNLLFLRLQHPPQLKTLTEAWAQLLTGTASACAGPEPGQQQASSSEQDDLS